VVTEIDWPETDPDPRPSKP